jgi:mercuric ion transport protein
MKLQPFLAGGFLSAIGATACCFGPLLLVTVGFGGAWAGRLRSLAPLQPVFTVLTIVFMAFAFHRLYIAPRRCASGEACESPQVLRRQRLAFWIVAAAIAAMIVFPYFSEFLY